MEGKWQRRGKVRVKSEDSWTPGLATRRREPIKKRKKRERVREELSWSYVYVWKNENRANRQRERVCVCVGASP